MDLHLKFEKSMADFSNFFQLAEIFTTLPAKFSINCSMHGNTAKKNQNLIKVCFDVSRKYSVGHNTMASDDD